MRLLLIELTLEHIYWLAGGVLATLGVMGTIATAKKNISTEIWAPFRDRFLTPRRKRREQLDDLIESVETLKTQTSGILAEVNPNGGGSLRDSIERIEKHIDYTNSKLRHLDQISAEAIFEMDEAANITFANHAFCDLLNADESELLDRRWLAKIPNSVERNRVLGEWSDAAKNLSPIDIQHEVAVNGTTRIVVRVQATPRLNRSNQLRGFFGKMWARVDAK